MSWNGPAGSSGYRISSNKAFTYKVVFEPAVHISAACAGIGNYQIQGYWFHCY